MDKDRSQYHKEWYIKNRKKVLQQQREYYQNNKDKKQAYQQRNKEHRAEQHRKWSRENSDRLSTYHREYYADPNNKKRKADQAKKRSSVINARRRQLRRECPQTLIKSRLRNRLATALRHQGTRRQRKLEFFGCTPKELKSHIENQFVDGMSWERFGEIHIDHIKPLHLFDLSDEQQLKEVSHYTNLRPLWAKDNLARTKSDYIQSFNQLSI